MEFIIAIGFMVFVAGLMVSGYLIGREHERHEWLHWLKTLKSGSCDQQCRDRFLAKNRG